MRSIEIGSVKNINAQTITNFAIAHSLPIHIMFGVVLFLLTLANKLQIVTVFSLVVFIFYLCWFYYKYFNTSIKAFAIIVTILMSMIGCFEVEISNIYLNELQTTSHFVGSFPLLVFADWILLSAFLLADRLTSTFVFKKKLDSEIRHVKQVRYLNIACIVCTIVYAFLFAQVLSNPSFAHGADRFAYAASLGETWNKINTILPYTIGIACATLSYGNKKIGATSLLFYALYMLWIGNKFGVFLSLATFLLMAYYPKIASSLNKSNVIKITLVLAITVVLLIVFAVVWSVWTLAANPFEYITARLAQQGQLWWKTFELSGINNVHTLQFFIPQENSSDVFGTGIYQIMYLCAPADIVDAKLATGSRYTEAGFACVYYLWGTGGLVVFSTLIGMVQGVLANAIIFIMRYGLVICSIITIRIWELVANAQSMFIINTFIEPDTLISVALLIIIGIFLNHHRKKYIRNKHNPV